MECTVEQIFKYSNHDLVDLIDFGDEVDVFIVTTEDGRLFFAEDFFSTEEVFKQGKPITFEIVED